MRLRADGAQLRRTMRRREVEAVVKTVPDDAFDEALELGAGDGAQSRLLARCAKRVLCTEVNEERLIQEPHPKVSYSFCDAEALPYERGRFDLVYSSNLLEHLPRPERALSQMAHVLSDDGVMVHIVPNRLWKLMHLALFYPSQAVSMAEVLLSSERRSTLGEMSDSVNNLSRERPSFLRRSLWPVVHGEYPDHLTEFLRMGSAYWRRAFSETGLHVAGYVSGLPIHSPYRFGLELPRRFLERAGLSSSIGYVVTKAGQSPDAVRFFLGDNRHTSDPPPTQTAYREVGGRR